MLDTIKKCSITKRMAIEWDLTDKIPINLISKTKTFKQKKQELIFMIDELNKKTYDIFVKIELENISNYINSEL